MNSASKQTTLAVCATRGSVAGAEIRHLLDVMCNHHWSRNYQTATRRATSFHVISIRHHHFTGQPATAGHNNWSTITGHWLLVNGQWPARAPKPREPTFK
jgi:hypothetical protein